MRQTTLPGDKCSDHPPSYMQLAHLSPYPSYFHTLVPPQITFTLPFAHCWSFPSTQSSAVPKYSSLGVPAPSLILTPGHMSLGPMKPFLHCERSSGSTTGFRVPTTTTSHQPGEMDCPPSPPG